MLSSLRQLQTQLSVNLRWQLFTFWRFGHQFRLGFYLTLECFQASCIHCWWSKNGLDNLSCIGWLATLGKSCLLRKSCREVNLPRTHRDSAETESFLHTPFNLAWHAFLRNGNSNFTCDSLLNSFIGFQIQMLAHNREEEQRLVFRKTLSKVTFLS